jgi:hypothetical protein
MLPANIGESPNLEALTQLLMQVQASNIALHQQVAELRAGGGVTAQVPHDNRTIDRENLRKTRFKRALELGTDAAWMLARFPEMNPREMAGLIVEADTNKLGLKTELAALGPDPTADDLHKTLCQVARRKCNPFLLMKSLVSPDAKTRKAGVDDKWRMVEELVSVLIPEVFQESPEEVTRAVWFYWTVTLNDKELRKLAEIGCDNWDFSVKNLLDLKGRLCQSMQITATSVDVSGEVNAVDLTTSSDEDCLSDDGSQVEEVAMVEPEGQKRKQGPSGMLSQPVKKRVKGSVDQRPLEGVSDPLQVGGVKFRVSVDSGSAVAYVDEEFGQRLKAVTGVKAVQEHRKFRHVGQGTVEVKERLEFEGERRGKKVPFSVYVFPRKGDGDVVTLGRSACKEGRGLLDFQSGRIKLHGDWYEVVYKTGELDGKRR